MKKLLLIVSVALIISCNEDDTSNINYGSDGIVGYWINPEYTDSICFYDRTNQLPENNYGLLISSDQTIIERKNSGWCGTPPISYADYEGTWSLSDSIIKINVGYWDGSIQYKWKIVEVNQNELIVIFLEQNY